MKAAAAGIASSPMVSVVNHDVVTPPKEMLRRRIEQADAAVAAARSKVDKLSGFVATAPKEGKDRQRAHLEGAHKALAQAIADRKGTS